MFNRSICACALGKMHTKSRPKYLLTYLKGIIVRCTIHIYTAYVLHKVLPFEGESLKEIETPNRQQTIVAKLYGRFVTITGQ